MNEIVLYVTSKCNLHCKECIMRHLMLAEKDYQMSLEEVQTFIKISEKSNYYFDYIISGGEPLLWSNLKPAINMIRQSNTCNSIYIFSNAVDISILDKEIIDKIKELRISKYNNTKNKENSLILKRNYPGKVRIVDRTLFWENPMNSMHDTLPASCLNLNQFLLMNYRVYACPHSASIILGAGLELDFSIPLELKFLENMNEIRSHQEDRVCTRCISNDKVRRKIEKKINDSNNYYL